MSLIREYETTHCKCCNALMFAYRVEHYGNKSIKLMERVYKCYGCDGLGTRIKVCFDPLCNSFNSECYRFCPMCHKPLKLTILCKKVKNKEKVENRTL